jgi:hypothetical protein
MPDKFDDTRNHPLWPAFQEWAKTRIGSQTMRALWWECFLAGANAANQPGKLRPYVEPNAKAPNVPATLPKSDWIGDWPGDQQAE